ncbi:MAG: hypothetical protein IJ813_02345 [Bacteroidales bacterium]|nr:hypothetical protein [Bacteroidales bacterium]
MVRFFGKASGKVDDKGRVVLPAIFRDAMTKDGLEDMTLIVKKNVQQCCLDVFTYAEWVHRSDKLLEGLDPELSTDDANFWTKYNEGVYPIVPDGKLGRLNIPSELLEKAGIAKEVVLSGIGYKLQIWAKETYEASLMTDEEFKLSAQRHSIKK